MCTAPGGALEAAIAAREQGLTRFIGITGHGNDSPKIYLEALQRFDFDSVLFPINPVQYGIPEYRRYAEELVSVCKEKDVGTMIIKTVAKQGWGGRDRRYDTWYEPFDQLDRIQEGVNFALSQDVTALCTAGDVRILPLFLEACENFKPLSKTEQEDLIVDHRQFKTIFDEHSI